MYSTNNEGKYAAAERYIRTLKNKIYKYMTSVSKKVYIDKLVDIVNIYNNSYHDISRMEPVGAKSNKYIDSIRKNTNKDPKLKIDDIFRISKDKYIFSKGYTLNWSENFFVFKNFKNDFINALNKEELELFTKKNCKKQIKKTLELKN